MLAQAMHIYTRVCKSSFVGNLAYDWIFLVELERYDSVSVRNLS